MKTNIQFFLSYVTHFFIEWEMFQTKIIEKIKTHFMFSTFFRKYYRLCDKEKKK